MSNIVERLNENIIADAFERKAIADGALCERLIRERKEAADTIEALRAENARLKEAQKKLEEQFHKVACEEADAQKEIARLRDLLDNALGWLDDKEHDKPLLSVDSIRAAMGETE